MRITSAHNSKRMPKGKRPRKGNMSMNISIRPCLTALLAITISLTALCPPANAESGNIERTRWGTLRAQGVIIHPLGDNRVEVWNDCGLGFFDFLNFFATINTHTVGGALASFEYVFSGRYGVEVGFSYWSNIVSLHFETDDFSIDGSPSFIMPTIGGNYHFWVDDKKDIYAGGLCCLGVIGTGIGFDLDISTDVALGLNLGADYYVREHWSVGGSVKYIDFGELDFSLLPAGLDGIICDNGLFGLGHLNTLSATLGVGYRF